MIVTIGRWILEIYKIFQVWDNKVHEWYRPKEMCTVEILELARVTLEYEAVIFRKKHSCLCSVLLQWNLLNCSVNKNILLLVLSKILLLTTSLCRDLSSLFSVYLRKVLNVSSILQYLVCSFQTQTQNPRGHPCPTEEKVIPLCFVLPKYLNIYSV